MQVVNRFLWGTESLTRHERQRLETNGVRWNLSHPYNEGDLCNHFTLRGVILNEAIGQGRISREQFHQVDDFKIRFQDQLITFTIPGTDHKVALGFEEVTHPSAIRALNHLIGRANSQRFYGRTFPMIRERREKGNPHGATPLQRKSAAARNLTRAFAHARRVIVPKLLAMSPNQAASRRAVIRRIAHAEFVVYRMKRALQEKIQQKEQEAQQLEGGQRRDAVPQISRLRAEVQHLQALKARFEHIDVYALTTALTTLPHGPFSYNRLHRVTQQVHNQVREDLQNSSPRTGLLRRRRSLNQTDEAYIKGVAGLLHVSRGEYAMYCQDQKIRPEKACLEDLVLREAVRVADKRAFDGQSIQNAYLFSSCSVELKREISDMFDEIDRLARVGEDFPVDRHNYAGNEPEAIRREILERWNRLNMDRIHAPARQNRILNVRNSLIVTGLGVSALAINASSGGRLLPLVRQMGNYLYNNPGRSIGSALTAWTGFNQICNFWSKGGGISQVLSGIAMWTVFGMRMTGTWNPKVIFNQAINGTPRYVITALVLSHSIVHALHEYVHPTLANATGLDYRCRRKWKWKRLAAVGLAGVVAFASAPALYAWAMPRSSSFLAWAMGRSSSCPIKYVTGAVDVIWNRSSLLGFILPLSGAFTHLMPHALERFPVIRKVGSLIFETLEHVVLAANIVRGPYRSVKSYLPTAKQVQASAGKCVKQAKTLLNAASYTNVSKSHIGTSGVIGIALFTILVVMCLGQWALKVGKASFFS